MLKKETTMKSEIIEIEWSWDQPIIQDILLKYYRDWLFVTPEIANNMVERILSISKINPPAQVLDIGCGLGYHATAFAQRGFQVFAFDPGDKYLEIAQNNFSTVGVNVNLGQMKCADLDESECFSLAWAGSYCPGQLSLSDVTQDFLRIYKALTPGGWFISNVAGKPKVPPSEKVKNWRQLSDCFSLSEKWADEAYFHEHCWFVYPETNKVIKLIEVERMYGVEEIIPILEEVGFTEISTADRLKGDTSAQAGNHFAFWCRKPRA
jgi:SAM-dependent methyltransferase